MKQVFMFESLDGQEATALEAELIGDLIDGRQEHIKECPCEAGTTWGMVLNDSEVTTDGDPIDPFASLCVLISAPEASLVTIMRQWPDGQHYISAGRVVASMVEG